MFLKVFYEVACALLSLVQSRNNNNWPNKKNDVITDLGGEGDFPMFRYGVPFFSAPQLLSVFARLSGTLLLTQPVPRF